MTMYKVDEQSKTYTFYNADQQELTLQVEAFTDEHPSSYATLPLWDDVEKKFYVVVHVS